MEEPRLRRTLLLLLPLLVLLVPTAVGHATEGDSAAPPTVESGYWVLSSDGQVHAFGDAEILPAAAGALRPAPAVDLEPTALGDGYWVLDQRGRVHTHGAATHLGDLAPGDLVGDEAATTLSATPAGTGYWIFTSRGRAVAFGDAVHHGDMAGTALNGPVLDSVPTSSGEGYYMVASDGGIFSFGDARFSGSMGDTELNAPVQSLVPDGDGDGYWLVASDGGVFSFAAPFKGSMGSTPLNRPVTGMVRYGDGYLMVGEDGGIFDFSGLPFSGSLGDRPPAYPMVAVGAFEVPSVGTGSSPSTATTGANPATTTTTTAPPPPPVDDTPLPAGMPDGEPDRLVPCQTSSRSAKVWLQLDGETAGPWAAFNACDRPLLIAWSWSDRGASSDDGVIVGPGAHFREPDGPVADHWSTRLGSQLVACWPEGGLPILLAGADDWVRPMCEDDSDGGVTALEGLPSGEPTHVLPCEDGSGATSKLWYHGPESDRATWGGENSCEDEWVILEFPGTSASDPYGTILSVAPGAEFHHLVTPRFRADEEGWEETTLASRRFDGDGDGDDGCPVGYHLYEVRADNFGTLELIRHCPTADDLGWYGEDPEGSTT